MMSNREKYDGIYSGHDYSTPCDIPYETEDGRIEHICPYEDVYSGYEDEMCRNMCGLGVDE